MLLNRLFKTAYPRLDWIQVEISSQCNSACVYCPHTVYRDNWQSRLFPLELYQELLPAFTNTKLVYLQGWGEPFTHPGFPDFLRLAKKAGCMVGTTTNGTMLDTEKIKELVDEGLDIICFSLAGIDRKNDAIRKGTRIDHILKCIETIHRIRAGHSADSPKINIAYMLLKSGLKDIHKIPAFAENAGISQTIISSLSLIPSPAMQSESIIAKDQKEYEKWRDDFHQIGDEANKRGVELYFKIVSPLLEESFCSENVGRALVVSSDGGVSPCVMSQIPVAGDNFYYFKGKRYKIEKRIFGNISDESLNTIWHKKDYKKFVRSLLLNRTPSFCQNCLKRFTLNF